MNYHIMVDEKFIDGFIDDAELASPGNNVFVIRNPTRDELHVKHPKAIWARLDSPEFNSIVDSITVNDKVFVHWFDLDLINFLNRLKKEVPLYVVFWGAEFYCEPISVSRSWAFDEITEKYVNKAYRFQFKWTNNLVHLAKQIYANINYKNIEKRIYEIKKRTVKRIDYLCLHEHSTAEFELLCKLFDGHHMTHVPFFYDQNADVALSYFNDQKEENEKIHILLGNSATETNNHLDVLETLKKYADENLELMIPLSYGSPAYQKTVAKTAVRIFKEKAVPVTSYMARDEYVKLLSKTDIGIMGQNRSQALGNCITILTMGKKLFLKKNNPLWNLFRRIDVKVFDLDLIKDMTFEEFSRPLTEEERERNRDLVLAAFSKEKRLSDLRNALQ